jgi:hypothetical protein
MKKPAKLVAACAVGLALSSGAIAQEAPAGNLGPAVVAASQQENGLFGLTGTGMLVATAAVMVVAYAVASDNIDEIDVDPVVELPPAPHHFEQSQHHPNI